MQQPPAGGANQLGYEILGAVKIKDGVFIGDELAAQDLEFVVANKVTHIINCCGRNVPNHWESIGVVYLTYYWVDNENQIILDNKDVVANECFHFLEEALGNAESVLIHSVRGQSRSCVVLAGYMMRKYCWGLRKTMEFLTSRRPDIALKPAFLQQLSQYERRLVASSKQKFTVDWSETPTNSALDGDELLLRNTYMNSHIENLTTKDDKPGSSHGGPKRKLEWSDAGVEDKAKLEKTPGGDRPHCKTGANGQFILRSIIKSGAAVLGGGGGGSKAALTIGDGSSSSTSAGSSSDVGTIKDSDQQGGATDRQTSKPLLLAASAGSGGVETAPTVGTTVGRNIGVPPTVVPTISAVSLEPPVTSSQRDSQNQSGKPLTWRHEKEPQQGPPAQIGSRPSSSKPRDAPEGGSNLLYTSHTTSHSSSGSMGTRADPFHNSGPHSGQHDGGNSPRSLSGGHPQQNGGVSSSGLPSSGHQHPNSNMGTSHHVHTSNLGAQPTASSSSAQAADRTSSSGMPSANLQQYQPGSGLHAINPLPPHKMNGMQMPPPGSSAVRQNSNSRRPSVSDSDDGRGPKNPDGVWMSMARTRMTAPEKDYTTPQYPRRREASPKVERYDASKPRGDSPMRHQRRDGSVGARGSSPLRTGPVGYDARVNGSPQIGSYDVVGGRGGPTRDLGGSSQLGGLLGSLRSTGPMKGPSVSSSATRLGMNAFRNAGPVKASREMFMDARNKSTRPATAPSTRVTPGGVFAAAGPQYGSRPNSPLLRRPGSPAPVRPGSPSRVVTTTMQFRTSKSLSSHMRRAPSPTPAFNRAPSPSRPRWRM